MSENRVTTEEISKLLEESTTTVQKIGDRTTLVKCELKCGFVMIESSSCIDPENYDQDTGESICMEHIENRMWELEGYHRMRRTEEQ